MTAAAQNHADAMQLFRGNFRAMACDNEVAVDGRMGRDAAVTAMRAAIAEVQRIEQKYSRYRSDDASIVHRINAAAGTRNFVECDPETISLLGVARDLHEASGGLFDITSGVLRKVWDFTAQRVPHKAELAEVLALIGFDRIERRGDAVHLPLRGMEIDFGGFGKEYAADRAARVMREHGVSHGYVNLGGDIAAIGSQPDGQPWTFGVTDPRDKSKSIANINIVDGGLATSGDSERYFVRGGVRYCHILNPKTGMPVQCWRSVSVSHVSTLMAGAFTTIAMLKEADATAFLQRTGAAYLLIDAQGRLLSNSPEQQE